MNAFVVRSVARTVRLGTIFRGLVPFVAMDLVRVVLLVALPAMALLLPGSM